MALGGSIYKLIFDSNALTALLPTRKELSLQQKIMEETRTATERYGAQLDVLQLQVDKGLISEQDRSRALVQLRAELPGNVAAQSTLNAELQRSEAILQSLMTAEQQEAAALEQSMSALAAASQLRAVAMISEQEYQAAVDKINATLPSVVAAERERLAVAQQQAQVAAQLAADIASTVAKLEEEKDTFGMSRNEIDQYRLAKRGASEADIAHIASLQQEVAALDAEQQAQKDAAAAAEEARQKKEASRQAIDSVIAGLTEESATFGMTREQLDAYTIAQHGATEADQQAVAALHAEIAAKQQAADASAKIVAEEQSLKAETDKLTADVEQLEQSLRDELATMNMSANEAKLYKLAQRGASDATLATARSLAAQHASVTKSGAAWQNAGQQALGAVPGVGGLASSVLSLNPAMITGAVAAAAIALELKILSDIAHALTAAVQESWKEIATLSREASTLGVGTQELIDMRDAAEDIAGMDASKFDAMLERLAKNTGDAAAGTGKAKVAFDALSLSAQAMAAISPDQQIRHIAEAFKNLDATPAEEARLAVKLFGQEGIAMLPVLRQGAAAFEDAARQSQELGNTVSELDAEQVKKMQVAFGDFGDVTKGIVDDLAVNLAPEMAAVAEQLVEALKPGSSIGDSIRTALEVIPPIIGMAADQTNVWIGEMQLAAAAAQQPALALVEGLAMVDQAQAKIRGVDPSPWLQEFAKSYRDTVDSLGTEAVDRIKSGARGDIQKRADDIRNNMSPDVATDAEQAAAHLAEQAGEVTTSAADELAKFREQIDTFGMAAHEVKAWKMEQEAAAIAAKDTTGAMSDQVSELLMMADEMRRLGAEHEAFKASEKARLEVLDATKKAQEELATAGMDTEAAQRYRLAQEGVSEELLKQLEIAQNAAKDKKAADDLTKQAAKEAAAEQKRHTDELKKYKEELEKQIATVGMSADEVKRWELAQNGATAAELDKIKSLQEEAAAVENLKNVSTAGFDAMAKGSREAEEALELARRRTFLRGEMEERERTRPIGGSPIGTGGMGITPDAITVTPGATSAPFSVTQPIAQPIAPQPDALKALQEKQLAETKKIVKNTATPIVIEELTL